MEQKNTQENGQDQTEDSIEQVTSVIHRRFRDAAQLPISSRYEHRPMPLTQHLSQIEARDNRNGSEIEAPYSAQQTRPITNTAIADCPNFSQQGAASVETQIYATGAVLYPPNMVLQGENQIDRCEVPGPNSYAASQGEQIARCCTKLITVLPPFAFLEGVLRDQLHKPGPLDHSIVQSFSNQVSSSVKMFLNDAALFFRVSGPLQRLNIDGCLHAIFNRHGYLWTGNTHIIHPQTLSLVFSKTIPHEKLTDLLYMDSFSKSFLQRRRYAMICPACHCLFDTEDAFSQHLIRNHQSFRCPYSCGATCDTPDRIIAHMRTAHRAFRS